MIKPATAASWKVELVTPAAAGEAISAALQEFTGVVSLFAAGDGASVRVSGYSAIEPDQAALRQRIGDVARECAIDPPPLDIVWLPATDWVAVNRESFEPLKVGRVWIRDSYHADPAPAGAARLVIDAATAFGTGHHGTTQGCLLAVERFADRPKLLPAGPALDLGCGSGILAMAAAKRLRRNVVATDIDPVAVAMARFNAQRNGLAGAIDTSVSQGYGAAAIRRRGPYALILANILARPLARMARDCARHLLPGGYAVLSGLLTTQTRPVIIAHRQHGLFLDTSYRIGEWSTLVLRRPVDRD